MAGATSLRWARRPSGAAALASGQQGRSARRTTTLPSASLLLAAALGAVAWWRHEAAAWTQPVPRRVALSLAPVGAAVATAAQEAVAEQRLDKYGRALVSELAQTDQFGLVVADGGGIYQDVPKKFDKPVVFIAGSTGDIGRRAEFDIVRAGHALRLGYRDEGRRAEVQYENRSMSKLETTAIPDCLVIGDNEARLEECIGEASVVIDLAGASSNFDILRPGMAFDETAPERTDYNGTKALVNAAKARGVKKFIYVSSVLTNARAIGESNSEKFEELNYFGRILDWKHLAEEYIKQSGLDYTIIRVAPLTNDVPKDVGGIRFFKEDSIRLKGNEIGSRVSRDDVALAILDAIYNPKASSVTVELVDWPKYYPIPRELWWDTLTDPTKVPKVGG